MTDFDLTQVEADALIALEKRRVDDSLWDYPGLGGGVSIPLNSVDEREQFMLDLLRKFQRFSTFERYRMLG